jgi:hypothetical protein
MDCGAFSTPIMADHFKAFGTWLEQHSGNHKAALTIHRYLPLFVEIERLWGDIPEYIELLNHFDTPKLRRFLLPVKWMEETGFIVINDQAKEDNSDNRRIASSLEKFAIGSQERTIIDGYLAHLNEKRQRDKTTLRSTRLALTPAAGLILIAKEMKCMPPNQGALEKYLDQAPGQRAAISGFVGFLQAAYKSTLILPRPDSKKALRRREKKLEDEMYAIMQKDTQDESSKRQWLTIALAYFHGLPKSVGNLLTDKDISASNGGMTVTWNNNQYWIPKLGPYLNDG